MGGRFFSIDQTHLACKSTLVENYVIPLPKLNEDQKKKWSSPQFGTTLGRILKGVFVLAGSSSSDDPAPKSRWGDAKPRWGTPTLGGRTSLPYNLSAGYRIRVFTATHADLKRALSSFSSMFIRLVVAVCIWTTILLQLYECIFVYFRAMLRFYVGTPAHNACQIALTTNASAAVR